MSGWNRREFVRASSSFAALGLGGNRWDTQTPQSSSILDPWKPGLLDIHHINTGRGNSTLAIAPDGTSLLVDAGAAASSGPALNAARPDESRRPGEWIGRYAARQLRATGRSGLDYALMTHLHGDHVGEVTPRSPIANRGNYRLTGISEVAEILPIRKLIDRGFPDYSYPARVSDASGLNYIAFAQSAAAQGTQAELATPGKQVGLKYAPERYPSCSARILSCNGRIWTGAAEESKAMFPPKAPEIEPLSENSCSIALRLKYGSFSYFTGGDLNCDTNYGRDKWRDVESAVAAVAGPVSVSTCNHHGYFDANGPDFVRALRARVWILQTWHASHPAISVLANLYSQQLYPGPRDVFCLGLHPAAALVCGRFSTGFKSSQGHVLVRVAPGGAEYTVAVLDDSDERDRVKAVFGPYPS